MNRLTLVLNAAILVVTFVVALTAGDVQGELLSSAVRTAGRGGNAQRTDDGTAVAVLRILQSAENFYPATTKNQLGPDQLDAIREALTLYRSEIARGIDEMITHSGATADLRQVIAQLGRSVRADLESILSRQFSDASVVSRLATEVIRHAG